MSPADAMYAEIDRHRTVIRGEQAKLDPENTITFASMLIILQTLDAIELAGRRASSLPRETEETP